jgi:hypothetical protein
LKSVETAVTLRCDNHSKDHFVHRGDAYVRTRPRSSDFTTLFWYLTPVDAIQLVLDLCDEDIHLSSLHFNPRRSKRANG